MAIEYTLFKSQEFKKKVIANLKGSSLCNFAIERILDGIILFENEKDNTTAFVVVEDGKTFISIPSRFEKEKFDYIPSVIHEVGHIVNGDMLKNHNTDFYSFIESKNVDKNYFNKDLHNIILDHVINYDMLKGGYNRDERVLLQSSNYSIPNENWEALTSFLIDILKDEIQKQGGVHTLPIDTGISIFSTKGENQNIVFNPPNGANGDGES